MTRWPATRFQLWLPLTYNKQTQLTNLIEPTPIGINSAVWVNTTSALSGGSEGQEHGLVPFFKKNARLVGR